MNLLQVLLNPEREERQGSERAVVCDAANVLQVGEFQLLALAARAWFGRELPEPVLGRLFSRYLLREEVPPWARHFARGVLARADRGEAGAGSMPHVAGMGAAPAPDVRRFWVVTVLLTLTLAAAFFAAMGAARHPASRLPPYFERDEVPPADGGSPSPPGAVSGR